jgi:hypothetical protein
MSVIKVYHWRTIHSVFAWGRELLVELCREVLGHQPVHGQKDRGAKASDEIFRMI